MAPDKDATATPAAAFSPPGRPIRRKLAGDTVGKKVTTDIDTATRATPAVSTRCGPIGGDQAVQRQLAINLKPDKPTALSRKP